MNSYEKFLAKAQAAFGGKYTYSEYLSGTHPKVLVTCPYHGATTQYAANHLKGFGCLKCFAESKKQSFEQFIEKAEEVHFGKYLYLRLWYVEKVAMVDYLCQIHGLQSQRASNHLKGKGCKTCGVQRRVAASSFGIPEVLAKLSPEYSSSYTYDRVYTESGSRYISFSCRHGHNKQLLDSHLQGKEPMCCSSDKPKKAPNFERFLEELKAQSPDTEFTYEGQGEHHASPLFSFECAKHGKFTYDGYHLLKGYRCPACVKTTKPAGEMIDYLKSLGITTELEFLLSGFKGRYDICIPDRKLLIEYHGIYWHSSKFRKSTDHKVKQDFAALAGYTCIQIFGDEWLYRRVQVEKLLAVKVGLSKEVKLHARKCTVERVSHALASEFYTANHIQGSCAAALYYGLVFNGELVAVAAFSERLSSRKSISGTAELVRYATKHSVRGGLSKLQKSYLRDSPQISRLLSFSDIRLFSGSIYKSLGYRVLRQLSPDYRYYDPKQSSMLQHKSKYQLTHLRKRFGLEFCEGKTEKQITEEAGIYRVYDAGKILWVLDTIKAMPVTSQPIRL